MDRRQFCRSTLAANAALSCSLLHAAEQSARAGPGIPALTLDEALDETVAWYRDNRWWWEPLKANN